MINYIEMMETKQIFKDLDSLVEQKDFKNLISEGKRIKFEYEKQVGYLKLTKLQYDFLKQDLIAHYDSYDNKNDTQKDIDEYIFEDAEMAFDWRVYVDPILGMKIIRPPREMMTEGKTVKNYLNECYQFWTAFFEKTHIAELETKVAKLEFLLSYARRSYDKAAGIKQENNYQDWQDRVYQAKNTNIYEVLRLCNVDVDNHDMAKCVAHSEETPSMHIYPQTNTWHCFGCAESGDSIDIAQKALNMSFSEAVKYLTT